MSEPVRVLIVDDHSVVREGIRTVLAGDAGLAVVGEAGSVTEALERAQHVKPDVILLDITMPGASGLEAVPQLLVAAPTARILMLSVHDNTEYVLQAVRAGAHGYLRKDTTPPELREAVRAVYRGDSFFSPAAARHLTAAIRDGGQSDPRSALETLTARETEVLIRIARGALNKEIAADLGISVRTVEAHRDNLMRKLDIRTVAGLTKLVLEAGLDAPS